jgi:hypothetical protein
MARKRETRDTRRNRFIDRGGNAFMPMSRMREIRWEEAKIRSIVRRGGGGEVWFRHVHFHCPSGCCLGTPCAYGPGADQLRGR